MADGFYEWKKVDGKKVPYRILLKGEEPFAFAGIWDSWAEGEKKLKTCCIITIAANPLVASIHDRMPVILSRADENKWLQDIPLDQVNALLKAYDPEMMKAYPISTAVNSPLNNSASIVEQVS